jgi:Asp/Glu/hydantoin racemase
VTDGIDKAMTPLRGQGIEIRCETLVEGPPAIESQEQADNVVAPLLARAAALEPQALGFVIACFGDPGLAALRARTRLPVAGIQEASVLTALSLGKRFGVISILENSVLRHLRAFEAMGVTARLAGDRALGRGVAALAEPEATLGAMADTGRALVETDGADVVIMGCAGMAPYRAPLESVLGVPVIEPCQAAAAMALGQIVLNLSHRTEVSHAP